MPIRIIVIHPLSIKRGHLPDILAHLTKTGIVIRAMDTYPVCLSTIRALKRSMSDSEGFEDYVQSYAKLPACALLLSADSDTHLEETLGIGPNPKSYSVRAKYRGSNWLQNPKSYDEVFTTFDPVYSTMVFSMFFSSHRGWGPLNQYV